MVAENSLLVIEGQGSLYLKHHALPWPCSISVLCSNVSFCRPACTTGGN